MSPLPYHYLASSGELRQRAKTLVKRMEACDICPRHCGVNRLEGETGFCKTGRYVKVASSLPHHGEEPVLSGKRGSGTLFFMHCNLQCVFCQNAQISQPSLDLGQLVTEKDLAQRMLELQKSGCHNINLVSPSHCVPQIVLALDRAVKQGLDIPLVYNSNGYDSVDTLKMLDGIVDIYLPDIKYSNDALAVKYSQAQNYVAINHQALREMYRQVGPLVLDVNGIAVRGIIVRHLILPHDVAGTHETLRFLAHEISPKITLSLMAQYYPAHKAGDIPTLSRKINQQEYDDAVTLLEKYEFENGWVQDLDASDIFCPDFEKQSPFG